MEMSIKQVNGQLICKKYDHNDPILFFIKEDSMSFADKFICQKCLQSNSNTTKMIPITQVIEEHDVLIKTTIDALKQFQQKMNAIKNKLIKHFEEIQQITNQWVVTLQEQLLQDDLVVCFKGNELFNQIYKDKIENDNKQFFIQTSLIFKKMFDFYDQKKCYDDLMKIIIQTNDSNHIRQIQQNINTNSNQQPNLNNNQQHQLQVSQIQLTQCVKQVAWSEAMAFNSEGTIMVSGFNQDLKIWKFQNGLLREINKLNGHTDDVRCIIFSKNLNWFVSGSKDQTIRIWKESYHNNWISNQSLQYHTDTIVCIIMNNDENELISCSLDNSIIVWKINCLENQIEYNYTLELKHTDEVYCISQNEQETALVSCGKDQSIILWIKNINKKWIYQHHVLNDDTGKRISFIDNNSIAWQQQHQGILHILQIQNNKLIFKQNLNIELNKETDDNWLFPTIVNYQKQIIIQRHNKFVYILKKQENGKLFQLCEPIDCGYLENYGVLTRDGQYLVLWINKINELRVYHIQYI